MSREIVEFSKMTGAGNDFILVDNRGGRHAIEWAKFAAVACDRRYGIGADGLLVINSSTKADFAMAYYNADGSYGGMCGNGGRCSARFVIGAGSEHSVRFEALDYIYSASTDGHDIRLEMKDPTDIQLNKILHYNGSVIQYHFVNTGSPHVVVFMNEIPHAEADKIRAGSIVELGRWISHHRQFAPDATNVNFVEYDHATGVSMRTYERGVEDETLACGTGAVACAIITALRQVVDPPVRIRTRGGAMLSVHFRHDREKISHVNLIGPAEFVFSGKIGYDAASSKILP